jgi:putative endonuclease
MKKGYVYIITSQPMGTLYTGVTSDLARRIYQHKEKLYPGFSSKYGLDRLVWYEEFPTMMLAIQAEKRIKEWRRAYKIELILKTNPNWLDMYWTLPS